jgi:hypothetical protein
MSAFKFTSLEIKLIQWGDNKGKYEVNVVASNDKHMMNLTIPPERAESIMTLIKPDLYAALIDLSEDMRKKLEEYLL